GKIDVGVEGADEFGGNAVDSGLQDQGRGKVAVTQHQLFCCQSRADLGVEVVVAVGGDQAGQGQAAVVAGVGTGEAAQCGVRRFGGGDHRQPFLGKSLAQESHGGGFPSAPGTVEGNEQTAHAALRMYSLRDSSTSAARTSSTVGSPNWMPVEKLNSSRWCRATSTP